jgi:hypothetical protein
MASVRALVAALIALAVAALAAAPPGEAHAPGEPLSPVESAGLARPPASLVARRAYARAAALPPSAPLGYPGAAWQPASVANFTQADRARSGEITRLVVHVAEGGYESTYTWFRNPGAGASAHYVVAGDGRIAQMVHDGDIAWHAGNWTYNASSIGIEHAGFVSQAAFGDAQLRGSARLAGFLARTYGIRPDRRHVIGHDEVPDPADPGRFGGASNHTDPGRNWSYARYMPLVRLHAGVTPAATADDASPAVQYARLAWGRRSVAGTIGGTALVSARGSRAAAVFRVPAAAAVLHDVWVRRACLADAPGAAAVRLGGAVRPLGPGRCGVWQQAGAATPTAGALAVSVLPAAGARVAIDAVRAVAVDDTSAPSAPTVTVTPARTTLAITWSGARDDVGVREYTVHVGDRLVSRAPGRSAVADDLACGEVYRVTVRAADRVGNRSPPATRWVRMAACPVPPGDLAATPGLLRRVALAWTAAPGAAGYDVLRDGAVVATTAGTDAAVRAAACGVPTTFAVRAHDGAGSRSRAVSATVVAPC